MKLVIAEKPSLARDIAHAICGTKNKSLPISGNGYTICACVGHLLELVPPAEIDAKWGKPWKEQSLPIFIEPWAKKPLEGKEDVLEEIGELLKVCESVIHAGDPDEEGQLIVDEVLDYFGYTGRVERVYVNDNIDINIKKAFKDLKDNNECRKDGLGALARQVGDAAFGFNETILATCRLGSLCSVGRVQTPTLGLVIERDLAILNHTKTDYYELFIQTDIEELPTPVLFKFMPDESLLDGEKHVFNKELLVDIANKLDQRKVQVITEEANKQTPPPLPYNLTVLLADMNKRFKFPVDKTQDITQVLRDKYKAITYNRTDSRYLKEEHYEQSKQVLGQAMENCGIDWKLDWALRSKAFNDAYVTSHHAIIPQDIKLDLAKMADDEQTVYRAIVEQYALQFLPPERYELSTSTFTVEGIKGQFIYKAKNVLDRGWKAATKQEEADDEVGKQWIDGGARNGMVTGTTIEEKQTRPPEPYTEGTLLKDMSQVAKYVRDRRIRDILKKKDDGKKGENGGIGTTATRKDIIKKLIERGYIEVTKNKVRSTEFGRAFFALLPEVIKRADTTALWWLIQQDIIEGKKDVYEIERSVIKVFESHRETSYKDNAGPIRQSKEQKSVGACPKCGRGLMHYKGVYSCSSNRNEKQEDGTWKQIEGCGFRLWETAFGKKLTPSNVADLIKEGVTKTKVKGLKSKAGKKFEAVLTLDKETGRVGCKFD